jgi:hypothetical protein
MLELIFGSQAEMTTLGGKEAFRMKRITVAMISGVIFGLVCLGLASRSPGALSWPIAAQIIASRTLIGFAIGISALSLGHWAVHGLLMGMLFSLPLAFSGLMAPDNPEFSKTAMWVWTVVFGMIYGLLIEVITSVLFRARQKK